jgi:hypothetical protein
MWLRKPSIPGGNYGYNLLKRKEQSDASVHEKKNFSLEFSGIH